MSSKGFVAIMIGLAAAGGGAHATEAHYHCAGGAQVAARFAPPGAAKGQVTLAFDGSGNSIILPQAIAADGARYGGHGVEFWIKGRTATLIRGGARETCAAN